MGGDEGGSAAGKELEYTHLIGIMKRYCVSRRVLTTDPSLLSQQPLVTHPLHTSIPHLLSTYLITNEHILLNTSSIGKGEVSLLGGSGMLGGVVCDSDGEDDFPESDNDNDNDNDNALGESEADDDEEEEDAFQDAVEGTNSSNSLRSIRSVAQTTHSQQQQQQHRSSSFATTTGNTTTSNTTTSSIMRRKNVRRVDMGGSGGSSGSGMGDRTYGRFDVDGRGAFASSSDGRGFGSGGDKGGGGEGRSGGGGGGGGGGEGGLSASDSMGSEMFRSAVQGKKTGLGLSGLGSGLRSGLGLSGVGVSGVARGGSRAGGGASGSAPRASAKARGSVRVVDGNASGSYYGASSSVVGGPAGSHLTLAPGSNKLSQPTLSTTLS